GEKSSSPGLLKGQVDATKKEFEDKRKLAIIAATEAASSLFGPAGWGIKIMEEVTRDRSASARAMSAILLAHDTSLDGLRELQDALSDKNWIVRAAAAQALGASRHRDQIQYLRPLLDDDKPAVRFMADASIFRLSSGEKTPWARPCRLREVGSPSSHRSKRAKYFSVRTSDETPTVFACSCDHPGAVSLLRTREPSLRKGGPTHSARSAPRTADAPVSRCL